MKKSRLLAFGALALLLASVLTGCQSYKDQNTTSMSSSTTTTTQTAPAPAPAPPPTTEGGTPPPTTSNTPVVPPASQVNPLSSSGNSKLDKPIEIEPVKAENLKLGDTVKFGPFEFTLNDVNVLNPAPGFPAGYQFVLLQLTFKNTSPDLVLINTTEHFKFYDPAGKSYKANQQAISQRSPAMGGNIKGGATLQGWLGYLLKAQSGKHTLQITLPGLGYANYSLDL